MLLFYVILLHILTAVGFYFLWDPMLLPLILLGNILFTWIGGEIFYHRYISHKSFTCSRPVHWFMVAMSLFSGQGGVLGWAIHHRHHHWHSDTDKDPHMIKEHPVRMWLCPDNVRGEFLEPDGSWDLLDDNLLQFLQKWYWPIHATLVIAVALISLPVAFYLIVVPNVLAVHQQGSINVLGHGYGYRNFDTPDHSTNSKWLSFLTFGDNYQNNHHAVPWSYNFAVAKGEFDISAWIIKNVLAKTVVDVDYKEPLVNK